MANSLKILIFVCIIFLLPPSLWGQKHGIEQKQLNKAVKKTWDSDSPSFSPINSKSYIESTAHLNGNIYIVKEQSTIMGYAYVGRVFSCRAGGCAIASEQKTEDDYEYFDYLILLDTDITVELVRVFNYQATHGQEVCSPAWLKQFNGYDGKNDLDYGKEIDAISGATISAISIIIDIQNVANHINKVISDTASK